MTFLWTETLTPAAYQPRLRHAFGHAGLLAQMPACPNARPHQGVKYLVTPDMPTNHTSQTNRKKQLGNERVMCPNIVVLAYEGT